VIKSAFSAGPGRPGSKAKLIGHSPQQRRIADRLGRGHQEQPLAVGGKTLDSLPEALFDTAWQRQRGS
jgi:hypothetical protein